MGLSARYANSTATRSEVQFVTTKLQVEASTTFANFPYNIEPSKVHLDGHDAMSAATLFSHRKQVASFSEVPQFGDGI